MEPEEALFLVHHEQLDRVGFAPRHLEEPLPESIQVGVVQRTRPDLALGFLPAAPWRFPAPASGLRYPTPWASGIERRGACVRNHSLSASALSLSFMATETMMFATQLIAIVVLEQAAA
ncbi:hypothetical protein [Myceligenerans halotolerans]